MADCFLFKFAHNRNIESTVFYALTESICVHVYMQTSMNGLWSESCWYGYCFNCIVFALKKANEKTGKNLQKNAT